MLPCACWRSHPTPSRWCCLTSKSRCWNCLTRNLKPSVAARSSIAMGITVKVVLALHGDAQAVHKHYRFVGAHKLPPSRSPKRDGCLLPSFYEKPEKSYTAEGTKA